MIKYFTSKMNYCRDWWKEAENFVKVADILREDLYVWDAENAGCDSINFAVDCAGKISYYVMVNEWFDSYYADGIVNEFRIDKIEPFPVPLVKRDWLLV